MKQSKTCPKCGSHDILRTEGNVSAYGAGNNLMLGKTILSAIPVPRYICCNCGYAEEWIDSRDLFQLREQLAKKM